MARESLLDMRIHHAARCRLREDWGHGGHCRMSASSCNGISMPGPARGLSGTQRAARSLTPSARWGGRAAFRGNCEISTGRRSRSEVDDEGAPPQPTVLLTVRGAYMDRPRRLSQGGAERRGVGGPTAEAQGRHRTARLVQRMMSGGRRGRGARARVRFTAKYLASVVRRIRAGRADLSNGSALALGEVDPRALTRSGIASPMDSRCSLPSSAR
jgi:hypothetical protein